MNKRSRQNTNATHRPTARFAVLLTSALLIAGCGGGSGSISIGGGQNPDPVILDFPIAYVRAPIFVDANGNFVQQDVREQITFNVGSDLFFRDRASPSADDFNITERETLGTGAVRDVDIAYDGTTLLFAMRGPFDANLAAVDQPTWNIWEYTLATDVLRRIIPSDPTAEIGHDVMPKYLPDGRILFSSTRQLGTGAILTDENKPAFPGLDEDRNEHALTLHVMDSDGSNLEQLSYNQSHDMDASVLADGQIVFSRWDHVNQNDGVNLYRMHPDGSNLELFYGQQSHATGTNGELVQFMQPQQLEDGRVMVLIRPFTDTEGGGNIIIIDTPDYLENTQPTRDNIGVLSGPAQEDATVNNVSTEAGVPSPGGRYSSVYPIQDGTGRLLVSWSQCRVVETDVNGVQSILPCTTERLADPNVVSAPPLYGIWMYDPRDNTQLPVVRGEEGFMFTEVISADPRTAPPVILDGQNLFRFDAATLAANDEAVLNIRSVYDFNGAAVLDIAATADPAQTLAADRPARFLRVVKAVSIPDNIVYNFNGTAFGASTDNGMREIVGYTMIEPDGSVLVKVPANTALFVSVVDADGKRTTIARHDNWMQLRPGQELRCNGCHDATSGLSHGRRDAFDSAYAGATMTGFVFPNTDPVWTAADMGETMAEVRANITCATDACSSLQPTMDIIYRDVWTDAAVRPGDPDIDYLYSGLLTPAPATIACQQQWQSLCRTIINYETHIHPLWSLERLAFDDMGNPVVDGNGMQVSNNCLNCHTPVDAATGMARVPAGQLELQDGLSIQQPDHFHAYRELLVTDNLQVLLNGAVVDFMQQVGIDNLGNPIFAPVQIQPPATTLGALASPDFFDRFDAPADLHYNILSEAEYRLIAEWLDVGAQYYNNPFDAPIN
ncbi:MAG: hypothetical protein IIA10_07290 [Proteobacteria bacterium]|nr:hypothetical protein [Pseudomonadota bacterium]